MYTTFSVVESIPPTHQASRPPSFVQFAPVVAVSFSPRLSPVVERPEARRIDLRILGVCFCLNGGASISAVV